MHPRQIRRLDDLSVGVAYALVFAADGGGRRMVTMSDFAGTLATPVSDATSVGRAMRLFGLGVGVLHCLTLHGGEYALWSPELELKTVPGFRMTGPADELLGDLPGKGCHRLVVPLDDWVADPRLHAADWMRGDWASEEARLRSRRDEAMRRALGF